MTTISEIDTAGESSTSAPLHDRDTETIDRKAVRTRCVKCSTDHDEFASGIEIA